MWFRYQLHGNPEFGFAIAYALPFSITDTIHENEQKWILSCLMSIHKHGVKEWESGKRYKLRKDGHLLTILLKHLILKIWKLENTII